ncbi:MAG: hypothetical protein ACWGON_03195, partial [Gemmatimonadota bacterium]
MIRPALAATVLLTILFPPRAEAQSGYLELWSRYRGEVGSERWCVLVGLAAGLFWLSAYDFSQREHFFLVLASPW